MFDIVELLLRLLDERPDVLDAGIDICRPCARRSNRHHLERAVEACIQSVEVLAQRRKLGGLCSQMRQTVIEPFLILGESLRALDESAIGSLRELVDFRPQLLARLPKLLDAACDTAIG